MNVPLQINTTPIEIIDSDTYGPTVVRQGDITLKRFLRTSYVFSGVNTFYYGWQITKINIQPNTGRGLAQTPVIKISSNGDLVPPNSAIAPALTNYTYRDPAKFNVELDPDGNVINVSILEEKSTIVNNNGIATTTTTVYNGDYNGTNIYSTTQRGTTYPLLKVTITNNDTFLNGKSADTALDLYTPTNKPRFEIVQVYGHGWQLCKEHAESLGGRLAVLDTQEKINTVKQLVIDAGNVSAFIGLSDLTNSGIWRWVDSTTASLFNWISGAPAAGTEVVLQTPTGWNAVDITQGSSYYVIEYVPKETKVDSTTVLTTKGIEDDTSLGDIATAVLGGILASKLDITKCVDLDALASTLINKAKEAMAEAIANANDSSGLSNIMEKAKALKETLLANLPKLPELPQFVTELKAAIEKGGKAIAEFKKKWEEVVDNIEEVIEQIQSIDICTFIDIKAEVGPDGKYTKYVPMVKTKDILGPPTKQDPTVDNNVNSYSTDLDIPSDADIDQLFSGSDVPPDSVPLVLPGGTQSQGGALQQLDQNIEQFNLDNFDAGSLPEVGSPAEARILGANNLVENTGVGLGGALAQPVSTLSKGDAGEITAEAEAATNIGVDYTGSVSSAGFTVDFLSEPWSAETVDKAHSTYWLGLWKVSDEPTSIYSKIPFFKKYPNYADKLNEFNTVEYQEFVKKRNNKTVTPNELSKWEPLEAEILRPGALWNDITSYINEIKEEYEVHLMTAKRDELAAGPDRNLLRQSELLVRSNTDPNKIYYASRVGQRWNNTGMIYDNAYMDELKETFDIIFLWATTASEIGPANPKIASIFYRYALVHGLANPIDAGEAPSDDSLLPPLPPE